MGVLKEVEDTPHLRKEATRSFWVLAWELTEDQHALHQKTCMKAGYERWRSGKER